MFSEIKGFGATVTGLVALLSHIPPYQLTLPMGPPGGRQGQLLGGGGGQLGNLVRVPGTPYWVTEGTPQVPHDMFYFMFDMFIKMDVL